MAKVLEIYTDGGCHPNPGFGACGYVVVNKEQVLHKKVFKKENTTNNVMELSAVIAALMWVEANHKDNQVYLYTDSQYVQKGITDWIHTWKVKKWRTSGGKPVKNIELWKRLDKLNQKLDVHFQWVRGHTGNKWNEYIDNFCTWVIEKHGK